MRKLFCAAALALACYGCGVKYFNAQPPNVGSGPSKVKINWRLWNGNGDLSANKPVIPPLNPKIPVSQQGSLDFTVCETTTFKLEPRYAPERTLTVNVAQPCSCKQETLFFTGTCEMAGQGPTYGPQSIAANNVGVLKSLQGSADFPIIVEHLGVQIHLDAAGLPIGPVPAIPVAGEYKISVPGQAGLQMCKDAPGPTGGDPVPALPIQVTVIPECPKP